MLRLLLSSLAFVSLIPPLLVALAGLCRLNHPAADLLAQFAAPAMIATAVLTVVLALMNLGPAMVSGLAVTALLIMACWPQWFPGEGGPARRQAGQIRVYAANLWIHNDNMTAMAASIRQSGADVLVLVEVGPQAYAAADQLFEGYPHRLYAGRTGHPSRSAIISRYPLEGLTGPRHRETVAARIHTPAGPINIIGAHLTRPWPYQPETRQLDQTAHLATLRRSLTGPVILAGDFNAVSSGRIGRHVKDRMGLIPAPAWPGTWPARLPAPLAIGIDHVWYSPDLSLRSRTLGRATGSDHRPVVTVFTPASPPET